MLLENLPFLYTRFATTTPHTHCILQTSNISNNSHRHRQLAPLEDGNCKHAWARLSLEDQNRESPVCFAGLDFRCGPLGETWGLSSVVDVVDNNDLLLGTAYMVTADTCSYDSRTPQDLVGGDYLTLVNEELVGRLTYMLNVPVGEITLNWDPTTALLLDNDVQYYYKELHWYAGPDALYKITPGAFTIDPEEYPYQQTELTSIPQSETRSIEIDDTVSPFKFYLSIHALVCEVPRSLTSSY